MIVLWIFIFLFVVAFDFSASVREDAFAAHRYAEESEGYYVALAGFERGLYELLQRFSQPLRSTLSPATELFDGDWREESYGEGSYSVRFTDEAGKVNLNRVDQETLRRIFTNLGVEEPRRSILVDAILDWIDEDDLHRASGAESDYYMSLSPAYTAKNGRFDTVEELLWVRGVTAELFYGEEGEAGLRDIFSVDSPIDRINLRTASAEVIHALVGLPLEKSREFVEERKKSSESTAADLLKILGIAAGDAAIRQLVFVNPTVITIESRGGRKDSVTRRQVKGVIRLAAGRQGYQLARWVDRDMTGNRQ
ncbi:MAG: general secretion pathway protein GspK [Deltaproteobacteria bacterium]|nr:general secretion pathway protein GspK [Deltaproteobacteria bacterium]